jgi:hypothetical protein
VRQIRVRPAEIRRRRILADIDDPFADGAGPGEMLEQCIAVTLADRLGQGRDVFVEVAEHFEDRILVGEKDVAPHGRVGGGNAREIAKAVRGELKHF